jgi:hypothetical protein
MPSTVDHEYRGSASVEAIKGAIAELAAEERADLASWFMEHEYDAWDKQMAEDFSPGGRGAHVVEQVNRQIDAGQFRPMSEGFRERQHRP